MNNKIMLFIALTMIIVGCKRITVDFTYSPTSPRAGETVSFTNTSSAGEDWAWTFGDNSTSLAKSPKKIYKKPGEYQVTLMVDSSKYQTCTKLITVYDTIPTFVCSTDSILHYQNATFTANIYNPFNHTLTYDWDLPANCVIQSGKETTYAVTVYFTEPGEYDIKLTITQNDKEFPIEKTFTVYMTKAPAIVMQQTDYTIVRQRIINDRIEQVSEATNKDKDLIEQTQDTMVIFNGTTFYASKLASIYEGFAGMTIQRIKIDALAQKWYIKTPDGLFVANMNGSYITAIDHQATGAMYVDGSRNRLYWASTDGLYAMPLIKSKNNQYTATPVQYNSLDNIDLITVNNQLQ